MDANGLSSSPHMCCFCSSLLPYHEAKTMIQKPTEARQTHTEEKRKRTCTASVTIPYVLLATQANTVVQYFTLTTLRHPVLEQRSDFEGAMNRKRPTSVPCCYSITMPKSILCLLEHSIRPEYPHDYQVFLNYQYAYILHLVRYHQFSSYQHQLQ